MMSLRWFVIGSSFIYLALLFAIAYLGERQAKRGKSLVNNPYVYALSLAVYCTAWTYYGSVGQAAHQGIQFLTTYLGPTLTAPLWWIVLRKIIRICKTQRITTLADFVSSRYGNNILLGNVVTIVCVLGVLPYISIQLKAIANSLFILLQQPEETSVFFQDTALFVTIGLALFTILFGTRQIDATERHEGMVTAIAFESLFKLLAFVAVGIYVTYGVYEGFDDVFSQSGRWEELNSLFLINTSQGYGNWFWLTMLSMLAIFVLPRQFQVAVKENASEDHLNKAMWLFPLYLFLINIFVLPIAFGGEVLFRGQAIDIDADTYVLAIPLHFEHNSLALLAFLGGLSAATSMIIVSTIALSTMISNNLLVPFWLFKHRARHLPHRNVGKILLNSRRLIILGLLLLAYLYFKLVSEKFSLVSIGLISFVGMAQLAPAILGGIFWKGGTHSGALVGLLCGFAVWFYTLVFPTIIEAGLAPEHILHEGPGGISFLKPYPFLGLQALDPVPQSVFWSLLLNTGCYFIISLITRPTAQERNQAEVFVDIFRHSTLFNSAAVWKGIARVADIKVLLSRFLGKERVETAFKNFRHPSKTDNIEQADYHTLNYAERLLAGAIGSASAHVLITSMVEEKNLHFEDVFNILQESQQLMSANKALREKSQALQEMGKQLRAANERLRKMDHLKDEFISTVTHEMRTPITSIRAFGEILQDNPDLSSEDRQQFLHTIIKETERMERLINQVLDLEKFESGKQVLNLEMVDINQLIVEALDTVSQVVKEKHIELKINLHPKLPQAMVDPDRLLQVVLNLVSNAIKFCDNENGKIVVTSTYLDNKVEVNVVDNGKGVPLESQEMIFEGFFQARNQNTKKPEGSGLGLTICKKIIEHHQGSLWIDSTFDQGAKFSFAIPVGKDIKPITDGTQNTDRRR